MGYPDWLPGPRGEPPQPTSKNLLHIATDGTEILSDDVHVHFHILAAARHHHSHRALDVFLRKRLELECPIGRHLIGLALQLHFRHGWRRRDDSARTLFALVAKNRILLEFFFSDAILPNFGLFTAAHSSFHLFFHLSALFGSHSRQGFWRDGHGHATHVVSFRDFPEAQFHIRRHNLVGRPHRCGANKNHSNQ